MSHAQHRAWNHPLGWLVALLLTTLLSTAWLKWQAVPKDTEALPPPGPDLIQRSMIFRDEPDGSISVTDARTGDRVAEFRGEQGFVRGTLRALSRERKRQGLGSATPLTLSLESDRRLVLHDPSTGEHIDLASFGATNREVFAALLRPHASPSLLLPQPAGVHP